MEWKACDYSSALKEGCQILRECFTRYDADDVFLSFNGGKDCTVLLDMTVNILNETLCNNEKDRKKLKVYYIRPDHPFPELEDFIFQSEKRYGLNMIVVNGSIKEALETIISENCNLKACLMGTRRTDPFSENLNFFEMTDNGWPKVMRVSPLLNWSYQQIWSYLLDRNVPYCKLYDSGYTSIGNAKNTIPNPALKEAKNGSATYKPAYFLQDGSLERNGRIKAISNGKL